MLFSTLVVETGLKDSFHYDRVMEYFLFVLLIFFASLSARLDFKRRKIIKRNKESSIHPRSGKEP